MEDAIRYTSIFEDILYNLFAVNNTDRSVSFLELDIKNIEQQDMKALVRSLELVSARVFDSVITLSQTASSTTPEMQQMFQQWINLLGDTVISAVEENGVINPEELAKTIGVTPATIISLALALHREGRIDITEIKAKKGDDNNREICGCLKG